jgi:hypothetical protein
MTHTGHPHQWGAPPDPALLDLGDGWDWLTISIPINHADTDVEQVAREAADAARAALTEPS